jgi:fatty acid desaturase
MRGFIESLEPQSLESQLPGLEMNTDVQRHRRKLQRGYTSPPQFRKALAEAHKTRFAVTTAVACLDHVVIYLLIAGAALSVKLLPAGAAIPVALVAAAGIGRQLRALECLVHEGSHYNWSRHRRRLNNAAAQLLAAFPTGARLADYRTSHFLHHGRFATDDDPDMQRYEELDLEGLDRSSLAAFVRDVLIRLPRYQAGWLRTVTSDPAYVLAPVAWAAALIAVPAGILLGVSAGVTAGLVWAAGYGVALPVIRFLGESSEHVYTTATSEFDATISNIGLLQRCLIHPHNDGYHTVHHLWPGVPHHSLRKLHKLLLEDPNYARSLRLRTRLLQDPARGIPEAAQSGSFLRPAEPETTP